MKRAWEVMRSVLLWLASWMHFLIVVPVLIALAVVLDPRKHDWLQRGLCKRIAFFSGARVRVNMAPGFDPQCTCIFMVNHVNLFDPFILYCAIPQLVRGWELESHFKIPIYGWLMKRFGNVPVPNGRSPKDLKKLWRLTQEAIDGGTSLIIFPEARRTRDGKLSAFEDGGFRLAMQLGVPIVPVTLDGSIRHLRTGDWILHPTAITVWLHDTIDTAKMKKEDLPALKERVRGLVAAPLQASPENNTYVSDVVEETSR